MKKFVMTTALVLGLAFAGTAGAQSIEETLRALGFTPAQIAAVTSISASTTAPTTGGSLLSAHNGVNLRVGSRGTRVSELQACMNQAGFNTGVVDGNFGPNTAAGVRSFQASQGLVVDGIVGIQTTPAFQAACPVATTTIEVDVDVDEDNDDPREDRDNDDLNGGESSLEDFRFEDESDEVEENNSNPETIARIEFEVEDGDIRIERLDLTFIADPANGEDEPWDAFEEIILTVDGEEVASENVSDEDDWLEEDEPFQFRFSGLDIVIEENDEAEIFIEVLTQNGIDGIENGETWTLIIEDNGIRGLDGAGIDQFIGDSDEQVRFEIEEEGDEDEITLRDSNDDPESTAFEVEDDDTSDDFVIFAFDVDVDEDSADVEFDDLFFVVEVRGGANVVDVFDDFELEVDGETYDDFDFVDQDLTIGGVTYLADGAGPIAIIEVDLEDEDFVLESGRETTIEVVAEFNSTQNYAEGTTIIASVPAAVADLWDIEGSDDLDADQIQGSAIGEEHTLLSEGAVVTLSSTESDVFSSSEATLNDTVEFVFAFNAEAFDEPIHVPVIAAEAILAAVVNASTNQPVLAADIDSFTITSAGTQRVRDLDNVEFFRVSSEEDFVVTIVATPAMTGTFFAELIELNFSAEDVTTLNSVDIELDSIVLDEEEFTTEDQPVTTLNVAA